MKCSQSSPHHVVLHPQNDQYPIHNLIKSDYNIFNLSSRKVKETRKCGKREQERRTERKEEETGKKRRQDIWFIVVQDVIASSNGANYSTKGKQERHHPTDSMDGLIYKSSLTCSYLLVNEGVKLLIENMEVNKKNRQGLVALDIFYDRQDSLNAEVGEILLRYKAKRASEVAALHRPKHTTCGGYIDYYNHLSSCTQPPRRITGICQKNNTVINKNTNITSILDGKEPSQQRAGHMIQGSVWYLSFLLGNYVAFVLSVCSSLILIGGLPLSTFIGFPSAFDPMFIQFCSD
ncbi:hypothetical protein Patl1_19498 [Pistacia atlantica]|uniref:Uncharacterized protein n=1 Tax=Pistacia atlantica TaxID=434234 RepID=A0ACC1BZN4_9ROSI|nr:hypothetical protein Patl1_19498 [Pistacia atlantica]